MSRDLSKVPRQTLTPRDERPAVPEVQKPAKAKPAAAVNNETKEEGGDAGQS